MNLLGSIIIDTDDGYMQATGMTQISRGGIFENFSTRGVFYRKFPILTGSRVF